VDRRAVVPAALGGSTGFRWAGGLPVDLFSFGNREGDVDPRSFSLERRERLLNKANVGSLGGRGHCDSKVIDLGDNK